MMMMMIMMMTMKSKMKEQNSERTNYLADRTNNYLLGITSKTFNHHVVDSNLKL